MSGATGEIDFKKCRMRFPPAASGTLEKPEPCSLPGWVPELWLTTSICSDVFHIWIVQEGQKTFQRLSKKIRFQD
jgi:hypothetical protein